MFNLGFETEKKEKKKFKTFNVKRFKKKNTVNIKMSQCKYLHIEEVSMCTTVHSKFHVKQFVLDEKILLFIFDPPALFPTKFFPPL